MPEAATTKVVRDSQRAPTPLARQQNLVLGRLVGLLPFLFFVRHSAFSCLCGYFAFTGTFGPPTYSVFSCLSLFMSSCVSILACLSSVAPASLHFPPSTLPPRLSASVTVALLPALFFHGYLAHFSSVDSRGPQGEDPQLGGKQLRATR